MPRSCRAAAARVLWLEDEAAVSPASDDLEALDGAMRVLDAAYEALERAALRVPRGTPLRDAALRLAGARRTWLAIAGEYRLDVESGEAEAFFELESASQQLRRLLERPDASQERLGNVVSLVGRTPSSRRGRARDTH